jgi:hypothetical protein
VSATVSLPAYYRIRSVTTAKTRDFSEKGVRSERALKLALAEM